MGKLDGKVVIVTGAAQGGGLGAALAITADGGSVVLVDRTAETLAAAADQIAARGGSAAVCVADVTDAVSRQRMVDCAIDSFGGLHALVNAAQAPAMRRARLLETSDEDIAEFWASGPAATLALMRACYPHMKAGGGGSIINFSSGAVSRPADYGVYAGCKAAIETIGRAAASEWGPDNIRVNTVAPLVKSPNFDLDATQEVQRQMASKLPLRRLGRPEEDLGRAIVFLVGDDSAYMTGNHLKLDGGSWNSRG